MQKVIAADFFSRDGDMDWGPASIDPNDIKPEWDTILLGRVTYDLWASFSPRMPEGVFSTTLDAAHGAAGRALMS